MPSALVRIGRAVAFAAFFARELALANLRADQLRGRYDRGRGSLR